MADIENMKADDTPEKDDDVKQAKKPAPKNKSKADKEDEILVKNAVEINPKLEEAAGGTVVMGWGRMNPITSGHEKLVNKIKDVARKESATPIVYLTHSQDAKKNPLSYDDKVMLAKKAFGNMIQKSNAKTIMQALAELQTKFKKVILVVGADRIKEFDALLNKYNGKDYTFDSIQVVSAGERTDPDSDEAKAMTADSMSASVMRKLASEGDFETFKKGLPKKLQRNAKDVYDMVRAGMKIAEEMELDEAVLNFQQRRQRALTMRRYKTKLAAARKRLARRVSSKEKLQKKARKRAISIIRQKVAGQKGQNYADLNPAEKMMIDKRVAKRASAVDRIAKRILPQVRKADIARVQGKTKTNEEFEMFLESYENAPQKRFHELRKKDGTVKLDKRFRAFKKSAKPIEEETPLQAAEKRLRGQHSKERENLSREHETEMDGLKARGLRKQIRDLAKNNAVQQEDLEVLHMIAQLSEDIARSIDLDETKALEAIRGKAQKAGISFEEVFEVYQQALEEDDHQWAFASVNAYINEAKNAAQQAAIAIAKKKEAVEKQEDGTYSYKKEESDHDRWGIKKGASVTINKKMYDHALKTLKDLIDRKRKEAGGDKNLRHGSGYYAAQIAKSYSGVDSRTLHNMLDEEYVFEEGGAGDRGTPKVTKRYKKDTPGENVNEAFESVYMDELFEAQFKVEVEGLPDMFIDAKSPGDVKATLRKRLKKPDDVKYIERVTPDKIKKHFRMVVRGEEDPTTVNEEVTQKQLDDLEKFADRLLDKFGVDVEFTRHFADRMNDSRNNPAITIAELQKLFKKVAQNKAKDIKANANSEAVLKDIQADLNLPVVIKFNRDKEEFEVVNKTIMRKKNFATTNTVIKY